MCAYFGTTGSLGAVTINIMSMRAVKVPATDKQVVNKQVRTRLLPHKDAIEWSVTMTVTLSSSARDANRSTIEGYFDGRKVNFADGAHDGEYYITSLVFDDNKERFPAEHRFTVSLIQV